MLKEVEQVKGRTDGASEELAEKLDKMNNKIEQVSEVQSSEKGITPVASSSEKYRREDFTVIQYLGEGSVGAVMQVKHKDTDELFALKAIEKQRILDHDLGKQLLSEAGVQMKVRHPNLLRCFDCFEDRGTYFLLLEYADGGDLHHYVKEHGPLSPMDAAHVFVQTVRGVQHLHEEGIIHRDLKAENILLTGDLQVKVADFGWCAETEGRTTFCGTLCMLAPEMIMGKAYNQGVDIWSLGVLLFEMLTGASPFDRGRGLLDTCENIVKHGLGSVQLDMVHADTHALFKGLLVKEAAGRISLQQVLQDPWVVAQCALREEKLKAADDSKPPPGAAAAAAEPGLFHIGTSRSLGAGAEGAEDEHDVAWAMPPTAFHHQMADGSAGSGLVGTGRLAGVVTGSSRDLDVAPAVNPIRDGDLASAAASHGKTSSELMFKMQSGSDLLREPQVFSAAPAASIDVLPQPTDNILNAEERLAAEAAAQAAEERLAAEAAAQAAEERLAAEAATQAAEERLAAEASAQAAEERLAAEAAAHAAEERLAAQAANSAFSAAPAASTHGLLQPLSSGLSVAPAASIDVLPLPASSAEVVPPAASSQKLQAAQTTPPVSTSNAAALNDSAGSGSSGIQSIDVLLSPPRSQAVDAIPRINVRPGLLGQEPGPEAPPCIDMSQSAFGVNPGACGNPPAAQVEAAGEAAGLYPGDMRMPQTMQDLSKELAELPAAGIPVYAGPAESKLGAVNTGRGYLMSVSSTGPRLIDLLPESPDKKLQAATSASSSVADPPTAAAPPKVQLPLHPVAEPEVLGPAAASKETAQKDGSPYNPNTRPRLKEVLMLDSTRDLAPLRAGLTILGSASCLKGVAPQPSAAVAAKAQEAFSSSSTQQPKPQQQPQPQPQQRRQPPHSMRQTQQPPQVLGPRPLPQQQHSSAVKGPSKASAAPAKAPNQATGEVPSTTREMPRAKAHTPQRSPAMQQPARGYPEAQAAAPRPAPAAPPVAARPAPADNPFSIGAGRGAQTTSQAPKGAEELWEQLLLYGFSEHQAREAVKRNSSIEAAVEWILKNGA